MSKDSKKGFNIVLAGAGGTGGYVFYFMCRLLYSLQNRISPLFTVVDGDTVSESNLLRQNFIDRDINRLKAEVLAERYGAVYGLKIGYVPEYIEEADGLIKLLEPDSSYLPVLIGCVDNNASRQVFDKAFEKVKDIIYIDSGNGSVTEDPEDNDCWTGQVVVGFKRKGKVILPPVGQVFPDILADTDSRLPSQSCGQVQVSNPQLMLTNVRAADIIFSYMNSILTMGVIPNHYTTFNAQTNVTRPFYFEGNETIKIGAA